MKKLILIVAAVLTASAAVAQPPRGGRPPMEPRPGGRQGQGGPDGNGAPRPGGWVRPVDTNQNGSVEGDEFKAAADRTFTELDKNGDGTLDAAELKAPPRGEDRGPRPNGEAKRLLPPFFFLDRVRDQSSVTRADFDRITREVFDQLDKNSDGMIDKDEARAVPGPAKGDADGHRPLPNAQFIGAELRFGDKAVTGQPFSATMVIEDTRRLFDGSTVTKQNSGAIYRDSSGRTRREQPLEVRGIDVVGSDNKPQTLVFITDPATDTQTFLDQGSRVARKSRLSNNAAPEPPRPRDARTESLGTKMVEGIKAEGTRTTFEIPAGELGNDKPILVIDERWFSPELQVVVMSSHVDPVAGEHVFKLVNIKRAEPSSDLFAVPSGFKIEARPGKGQ